MKKVGFRNSEKAAYAALIIFLGLVILMALQYFGSGDEDGHRPSAVSKTRITTDGVTVLKSNDGFAMLVLYPGTESGADEITIQKIENPAIESDARVSGMYKFGPSGARFSKPVEIRLKYDESKVHDCPPSLFFYHFDDDGTRKEVVPSKNIYCGISTAVFEIDGFSQGYAGGLFGNDIPNPPDVAQDFSNVNWLKGRGGNDVSGYSKTVSINDVSFSGNTITFDYNGADNWPEGAPFEGWTGVIGNPWIFFYREGKWQATTCDWMGRSKPLRKETFTGQCGLGGTRTLGNFQPQKGEKYGFMISSFGGRTDFTTGVRERSNVVMAVWTTDTPPGGDVPVSDNNQQSQGPNNAVDCNDPTGATPAISSVTPATAKAGDIITVTGIDLTTTIQFYSAAGRSSYCGSRGCDTAAINSKCNELTFRIPNDLPSGQYELKIYKARDKISNGKALTVTGTATANNANNPTPNIQSCQEDMKDLGAGDGIFAKDDGAAFTQCRDVVWMVRNTNTALACSPDFTYIGIPAATWRGWVENEAKAVLDACAVVNHDGNDPPQLIENLRSALEKYWKNCIHRKGISCVCNPNPADPVCGPFVPLIGGRINAPTPTTISPIVPSSIWNPKQTNNGWFPQLSPDGRYVTYGFGESWVADLQTGEERIFGGKSATEINFGGQWIRPDTFTFLRFLNPDSPQEITERHEVKVGEWIDRKTNDDPSLVAGNNFVASDNHWASWIADTRNNNFRVAYDNTVLATGVGGGLSISEDWIVHATDKDNSAIQVWRNRQKTATYSPQTPLHSMKVNKGYITYGGYGPVHGINPQGQDIDLTIVPWRNEGVGGVVFVNDQPWTYTVSWDESNKKGYILIRPWGEKSSIVIEAAAVSVHVVYVNNEFIVAYNDDQGNMKVVRIPANSQRIDLANPTTANNPTNPAQNNPSTPTGSVSIVGQKNLGTGTFPDVAFYLGKLYIAVDNKLYRSSYDLSDVTLVKDFGYAGFPRLTVYNNVLWMAYRGDHVSSGSFSVTLWRSDTGNIEELPYLAEGNDPVAVGYGYLAFNSQGSFKRRAITGGNVIDVKQARPTGINRILQDGGIVSVDQTIYPEQEMQRFGENSYAVDWGTKPYVADDLTVVEGPGGNLGRFGNDASSQFTVFAGEESFTPHAASDGSGTYAIATWGKPGVRIAVIRKS